MTRKTDIRTLRKQLESNGVTVFKSGGNWISSAYIPGYGNYQTPFHYSVKTEREAIEAALLRIKEAKQLI